MHHTTRTGPRPLLSFMCVVLVVACACGRGDELRDHQQRLARLLLCDGDVFREGDIADATALARAISGEGTGVTGRVASVLSRADMAVLRRATADDRSSVLAVLLGALNGALSLSDLHSGSGDPHTRGPVDQQTAGVPRDSADAAANRRILVRSFAPSLAAPGQPELVGRRRLSWQLCDVYQNERGSVAFDTVGGALAELKYFTGTSSRGDVGAAEVRHRASRWLRLARVARDDWPDPACRSVGRSRNVRYVVQWRRLSADGIELPQATWLDCDGLGNVAVLGNIERALEIEPTRLVSRTQALLAAKTRDPQGATARLRVWFGSDGRQTLQWCIGWEEDGRSQLVVLDANSGAVLDRIGPDALAPSQPERRTDFPTLAAELRQAEALELLVSIDGGRVDSYLASPFAPAIRVARRLERTAEPGVWNQVLRLLAGCKPSTDPVLTTGARGAAWLRFIDTDRQIAHHAKFDPFDHMLASWEAEPWPSRAVGADGVWPSDKRQWLPVGDVRCTDEFQTALMCLLDQPDRDALNAEVGRWVAVRAGSSRRTRPPCWVLLAGLPVLALALAARRRRR